MPTSDKQDALEAALDVAVDIMADIGMHDRIDPDRAAELTSAILLGRAALDASPRPEVQPPEPTLYRCDVCGFIVARYSDVPMADGLCPSRAGMSTLRHEARWVKVEPQVAPEVQEEAEARRGVFEAITSAGYLPSIGTRTDIKDALADYAAAVRGSAEARIDELKFALGAADLDIRGWFDRAETQAERAIEAEARIAALTAQVAAARRLLDKHYMPWPSAGGPNECEHGYAEGIPCQRCDRALLAVPTPDAPLPAEAVLDAGGLAMLDASIAEIESGATPTPVEDLKRALHVEGCTVCGLPLPCPDHDAPQEAER